MLQCTHTETSLSSDTQPDTDIETKADRSSSSGLSIYASEGFGYVNNDSDKPTSYKRAHVNGVISAHHPRRTDLSTPGSVSRTGSAHYLTPQDTSENAAIGSGVDENLFVNYTNAWPGTINPNKMSLDTAARTLTIASASSVVLKPSIIVLTSTLSSPQGQTTSGNHPMTSQSHAPSLGIVAGSAVGGTAVLTAAIFMALFFVRRRPRMRNGIRRSYSDKYTARSDSSSSWQADLETSHEHRAVVIPVDHDGGIISAVSVPPSTAAVPLSTTATTPSVPVLNVL
ncbi:hypothetical protein BJ138DRAFT_531184 [Hygrophoropsis aurantiaca]|uniref:Uncharacterized protein n=1 Tax=Hygrophoropsis aurantiaca TaxID=72124 RepID=A0ACB8A3F1_9AGAM|nr:hypothetical protein BJ138DRAFT_531184 [Hygrophoropsis aurantiaca]